MVKKIISYVIVFILIALLLATTAITIMTQTILKEEFIVGILDKNNYYSEVYSQILESFKNNTIQSGLEEDVLDGIITEEQIKTEVTSLITYLYTGKEASIDTESVKTKLQANIDKVIKENNKKVTDSEKAAINTYIDTIAKIYRNGISYAGDYVVQIRNIIEKVQNIMEKVQPIAYIATAVVIVLLLIINMRKSFSYLSIACISSGTLCIILKILEISTMKVQNILFLSKAFSKAIISVIEDIMLSFTISRNSIVCNRFITYNNR